MADEHYLSLQHSESVVARKAATIFAAYVQACEVTPANEDGYLKKSVELAARIAVHADRIVKSDGEWMKDESGSLVL